MKIPHKQLEKVRKNPTDYRGATFKLTHGFAAYPTASMLRCALIDYHKTKSLSSTITYFESMFEKHRKPSRANESIKSTFISYLRDYDAAYADEEVSTVKAFAKIYIPIEDRIFITGEILRIDIVNDGGYSACILEKNASSWQKELRMPLLQDYLATELKCSQSDVMVGIYSLASGEHSYKRFTQSQIKNAYVEITSIARILTQ